MLQANEVLAVNGVSVSFSGNRVLRDVHFRLRAGEFSGLIGANGSGKTTLLRTILGFQAPSSGSVPICGQRGLRSVGYVPQKIALDPFLSLRARDVVALGLEGHRLGLPLPSRKRAACVNKMLEAVDATGFADQRLGELSGGQQQRVLIAHALVRRPRLLLLDEPLANLDIRSIAGIVTLLRRLSAEQQITVLLSAHDMNPLLSTIDRIVYLANGRAASGTTDEVVRGDVLSRLYGFHIDVIRVHGRILVILFRPLLLNSISAELGEARGVPRHRMELWFLTILALATAVALPVVGALLVFSLMVGPAAAARSLTNRPVIAMFLSVLIALITVWVAIVLSYISDWPIGLFVGVLGAIAYGVGRAAGRGNNFGRSRLMMAATADAPDGRKLPR